MDPCSVLVCPIAMERKVSALNLKKDSGQKSRSHLPALVPERTLTYQKSRTTLSPRTSTKHGWLPSGKQGEYDQGEVYTPSQYSCDSRGLYGNGHSKGVLSISEKDEPTETTSEQRTSNCSSSRRPSGLSSNITLHDENAWSCATSVTNFEGSESGAEAEEAQRDESSSPNVRRHTLLNVFRDDALDDYFSERACTPSIQDDEEACALRSVTTGSPVFERGLMDWPAMSQIAHDTEVCEDAEAMDSDAIVFAHLCETSPLPTPAPLSSCADTLDRVYTAYAHSPLPSPLPSPASQASSADTLFNEREEMIDVFVSPSKDAAAAPVVRWSTTVRQCGLKHNRVASLPLASVDKLYRSNTVDRLSRDHRSTGMLLKPVVIKHDPEFTDLINNLRQWRMSWEMPREIKPGVAYVPPTTEQHVAKQAQALARQSSESRPHSICDSPSSSSTVWSLDDMSTLSGTSRLTTPTFGQASPSLYSVLSDGVTPAMPSVTENQGESDWSAHAEQSLRNDIDTMIQLYSDLKGSWADAFQSLQPNGGSQC